MVKNKKKKQKWYYDASALRKDRQTIDEIRGKSIKKDILISYLALGVAYGSCCNDGKVVEETFKQLIEEIRDFIKIVKNDIPEKLFDDVRKECKCIKIADAIHLATSLKYKCENLRSSDRDLYGLRKEPIKELCKKYQVSNFAITKM